MPLVTLLQAVFISLPVFLSLWNTSFSIPNFRSSSILTTRASDGLVCRHDEALLQRRTWSRGATADSFGLLSSLSSGLTRKTPSTLALLPSEEPQSMHAALSKRAGMYFASLLWPSKSQPFPREGNCMSLKACYPYFKIPTLAMSDTWVMGLYDTCSYDGPSGRSVSTMPYHQPAGSERNS